jgi:hypothetical protein
MLPKSVHPFRLGRADTDVTGTSPGSQLTEPRHQRWSAERRKGWRRQCQRGYGPETRSHGSSDLVSYDLFKSAPPLNSTVLTVAGLVFLLARPVSGSAAAIARISAAVRPAFAWCSGAETRLAVPSAQLQSTDLGLAAVRD